MSDHVIVVRSEHPISAEQKAALEAQLKKEFPDHKVLVLQNGLSIEFVKAEAP